MRRNETLSVVIAAGSVWAGPTHAQTPAAPEVPAIGMPAMRNPGPMVGHLYVNAATRDVVFTPAAEYLANRARLRGFGDDLTGDGVEDDFLAINTDPCPIGTPTAPNENVAAVDTETTQGDHHLYKAQINAPDMLVESMQISFWTAITDTDSDTVPDITSADTDSNGQIDFSYSFHGIQPDDRPPGLIGYQLAAPGIPGTPGVIDGTTGDPVSGSVGADDGVIDYANLPNPPQEWSHTRVLIDSIIAPMGRSGLPFISGLLPVPSTLARFSIFLASQGETPDPDGPPPPGCCSCARFPNSDFFGWGAVHPPDGTFYGDLNCEIDDDGDTVADGRPWSSAYMALSGRLPQCGYADMDGNRMLNVDDIDVFVAAFLASDLAADCDANSMLNVDDIDCFVAAFLAGCS